MAAARLPRPSVVDFETHGIEKRPEYPPVPVGVSIQLPKERAPTYYAWGHPSGNNCTKAIAKRKLQEAYAADDGVLFYNGKFDADVADTHMGVKIPSWERMHDGMYLMFLDDPHARSLGLKESAERVLGMKPEERNAVQEWLIDNGVIKKQQRARWGAHIARADGAVVGKYANGDTKRTIRLFNKLWPRIRDAGMLVAYDVERELMPILLENERAGIRVDVRRMKRDLVVYEAALEKADAWLRRRLSRPTLNLDSSEEVQEALQANEIVTEWTMTTAGKISTAKKNMPLSLFHDKRVAQVYGYRQRLATCLSTFLRPWLETALASGGRIYTSWNQVRQPSGDGFMGTRTGRLSSTPNLQNIPKDFDDKDDGYAHPTFLGVPPLPMMRVYVLPDEGHVICHRDYNQQELRILAHFEDGALLKRYLEDPLLDVHDWVKGLISTTLGREIPRRPIKIINFGKIYGEGLKSFMIRANTTMADAKEIDAAHRKALPGVNDLQNEIKATFRAGEPIRTWDGRLYYCEPSKIVDGRLRTFEYKGLNYLIQGSAAGCTKRAIINYHKTKRTGRFLLTVHDENNTSAPKGDEAKEHKILREAMEGVAFDLPMLTDGKTGPNWHELRKAKEK